MTFAERSRLYDQRASSDSEGNLTLRAEADASIREVPSCMVLVMMLQHSESVRPTMQTRSGCLLIETTPRESRFLSFGSTGMGNTHSHSPLRHTPA